MNDSTVRLLDFTRHDDMVQILDDMVRAERELKQVLAQPFPTMRVACCVAGVSTEDLEHLRELDELAGSVHTPDEVA